MNVRWNLIWPLILLILLPLAAAWFAYPETHLPPGFGIFPPGFVRDPPGFNLAVFLVLLAAEGVVALLLLAPRWFGFTKTTPAPRSAKTHYPIWFWIGAALMTFFWWLMWTRVTVFGALVYYAFTPLWWGFILVLDGLVYRRSGGDSLIASRPRVFAASALFSVAGWLFFEYYNYFTLGNWYYPHAEVPGRGHTIVVALYLIAYTTVWPAIFEWYALLNTCPRLVARWSRGPRLALPGTALLWGGLALLVALVFFPYPLFWALWVGTLAVFAGSLIRLGIPTPFSEVAKGNWSPLVLMALASTFNGFFWEMWNWGSARPEFLPPTNPNFWLYDIPYVDVIHGYSEMPLLGYFGYLPLGLLAWVMFISAGRVFSFDTCLTGTSLVKCAEGSDRGGPCPDNLDFRMKES